MDSAHSLPDIFWNAIDLAQQIPLHIWLLLLAGGVIALAALLYAIVYVVAPVPRAPRKEEESYITVDSHGKITDAAPLPCWQYSYLARKQLALRNDPSVDKQDLDPADIFLSVVVPAYNEEERLPAMLEEAITFLDSEYGTSSTSQPVNGAVKQRKPAPKTPGHAAWEILVVSDGSRDRTTEVALEFAKRKPGCIRVVTLSRNRGKGGAVIHGMRHVRGEYIVFADADAASKFSDLAKLITAARGAKDEHGRAVAVGSRAHLVGSDAVVKRSRLRNFLMHSFHLLLWLLTPAATSAIKDTQCGFKLLTREALPYIVPHMHSEGWIFDVEMLMLAESAGVPMVEVPIAWKEVGGSKLNVVWDSLGMAWGLAVLRLAWALGVYRV